jgi:transcriptional regulator with XRE-family HTH domain
VKNLSIRNRRVVKKRRPNGHGPTVEVKGAIKSKSSLKAKRGITNIDVEVGQRIRIRRNEMGISQDALAKALGVSFQQIQKYEKGVNRISSGRLVQIAQVLESSTNNLLNDHETAVTGSSYGQFMMTREGPMLLDAMVAIDDVALRRAVVALARSLANIE